MAFVIADRVRETTTTTGTGTITLAGAYTGFQAFSAGVGNGNSTYYTISNINSNEWEVGIGTYTSSGNTLSRDTVLSSSNSGSLVNFSAGTKDAFVTQPASRSVLVQSAGSGLFSSNAAFTANGLLYANATTTVATGSTLTFDGTTLSTNGLTATGTTTLSGGTANAVAYLNASKVVTTGSALTFDGTNLGIGTSSPDALLTVNTIASFGAGAVGAPSVAAKGDLDTGMWFPAANTLAWSTGGTERARIDSSGNVGLGLTPVANNGILQLSSYASVKAMFETATITAAAPSATTNFDVITQAVQYYTTNASANFTVNIRGNSGTSLNTILQTGQSCTIALLVTNGATPYYPTAHQVDGSSVTPKWQGGTAPTGGNASSVDIYVYTVVKTGSAAFTIFASQTKFA